MSDRFVLAITGPSGSGKSTVADRLAKQLKRCVNVDADHIKHMIVSGFSYELKPDGTKKWNFNQWELVGDSLGLLARNFLDNSYNVIINGYLDEQAWLELQKHVILTHKVVLLPHIDMAVKRDSERSGDLAMGKSMVEEHHDYFSNNRFYRDFVKIDSTNHNTEETVHMIIDMLESQLKT